MSHCEAQYSHRHRDYGIGARRLLHAKDELNNRFCDVRNGYKIGNSKTYSPHDSPLTINDNQLAALLEDGHLQIGHQVAQQLSALHAIGLHPIALFYPTNGQRETYFSGIQRSNIIFSPKTYVPSSGIRIGLKGSSAASTIKRPRSFRTS